MLRFQTRDHSKTIYFPIVLFIIVIGIFVFFSGSFQEANRMQEKEILQTALNRSIVQCYALEGSYPVSLAYLKDHYGLTYNEEHFFIDYNYIGGNLRPDITIIERD